MSDPVAKPDLRKVHMDLARWYLAHRGQEPDQPETLFDVAEDQAIEEAKGRHPTNLLNVAGTSGKTGEPNQYEQEDG
jgi:hypothetical protein